jgi:hypothetical protein
MCHRLLIERVASIPCPPARQSKFMAGEAAHPRPLYSYPPAAEGLRRRVPDTSPRAIQVNRKGNALG